MIRFRCAPVWRLILLAAMILPHPLSSQPVHADQKPPATYNEVMRWYLDQAEGGKADAAYLLGLQYENGVRAGGKAAAQRWFEEAAGRGHPEASFRVASRLWPGDGASPGDADRARKLFGQAAKGGLVQAAFNLGVMAERGAGGPLDLVLAEFAYRQAARGGVAGAFLRLAAVAQISGQDDSDILAWLMLGSSNGDVAAAGLLDVASQQIDAETIATARKKAAAW